ncbi:hypothetical protein Tco_1155447 [Tanacetum coccineum]
MSTLTQDVLAASSENHPPMLENGSYDTWQSRLLIVYKQERETKLADEFDRFTSEKGETIQSYNLKFAKLVNDIIINGI